MRYWLIKSEPKKLNIDDLATMPNQTTPWFGIRNYQSRNFMWKQMRVDDAILFIILLRGARYYRHCQSFKTGLSRRHTI